MVGAFVSAATKAIFCTAASLLGNVSYVLFWKLARALSDREKVSEHQFPRPATDSQLDLGLDIEWAILTHKHALILTLLLSFAATNRVSSSIVKYLLHSVFLVVLKQSISIGWGLNYGQI
ncbi:hypothetical protein AMECASPLE_004498 [Ameca splendens]|uniref:Uncharacterized protein n=1 Tax=Ameca splendens TaxID=208324 RepID=A0ABV0XN09_9TELE